VTNRRYFQAALICRDPVEVHIQMRLTWVELEMKLARERHKMPKFQLSTELMKAG